MQWTEKLIIAELNVSHCPFYFQVEKQKTLQWTGGITDCVELVYAFHTVGCIDNGTVSLKDLFQTMGTFLGIDLKDFSRTFTDIKNRTKSDRTTFLDKLKRAMIVKMEKSDERPSRK